MDNFIKWQACDYFSTELMPGGKEIEHHITRQLVCSHPKVEKVWFVGFCMSNSQDPNIGIRLEIMLKDGGHQSFRATEEQFNTGTVPEAERYLGLLAAEKDSISLVELKKRLYKVKPLATFHHVRKSGASAVLVYICCLERKEGPPDLFFEVPVQEIGDGIFGNAIEAQLLIRYMVQPENYA